MARQRRIPAQPPEAPPATTAPVAAWDDLFADDAPEQQPAPTYTPDPEHPIPFDVRCDDCSAEPLRPCAEVPPHSGAYHLARNVAVNLQSGSVVVRPAGEGATAIVITPPAAKRFAADPLPEPSAWRSPEGKPSSVQPKRVSGCDVCMTDEHGAHAPNCRRAGAAQAIEHDTPWEQRVHGAQQGIEHDRPEWRREAIQLWQYHLTACSTGVPTCVLLRAAHEGALPVVAQLLGSTPLQPGKVTDELWGQVPRTRVRLHWWSPAVGRVDQCDVNLPNALALRFVDHGALSGDFLRTPLAAAAWASLREGPRHPGVLGPAPQRTPESEAAERAWGEWVVGLRAGVLGAPQHKPGALPPPVVPPTLHVTRQVPGVTEQVHVEVALSSPVDAPSTAGAPMGPPVERSGSTGQPSTPHEAPRRKRSSVVQPPSPTAPGTATGRTCQEPECGLPTWYGLDGEPLCSNGHREPLVQPSTPDDTAKRFAVPEQAPQQPARRKRSEVTR